MSLMGAIGKELSRVNGVLSVSRVLGDFALGLSQYGMSCYLLVVSSPIGVLALFANLFLP